MRGQYMGYEFNFSANLNTATTTYTGYLNLFDLVQVEKHSDQSQGSWHTDWFEGRVIP